MSIAGESVVLKGIDRLDSRLRRLIYSTSVPDRYSISTPAMLENEMRGSLLIAGANYSAESTDSATVSKRVLVKVSGTGTPADWGHLNWCKIVDDVYTVECPVNRLEDLALAAGVEFVSTGNRMGPALDTALVESRAAEVHLGSGTPDRKGRGVIVGVIDYGFDFTLSDFLDDQGNSRVLFYWDQGLSPAAGEASPADYQYGVEYDRDAINSALGQPDPFAHVRSDPPLKPEEHGTHVAGIAVGNGSSADADFDPDVFVGVAPEAEIIFVQPDADDTDGTFTDSVHVTEAIEYIFAKAKDAGLPCVINMSLGQNGGSHDGESVVERAIDRLLEVDAGRAMVVAAGNEHIWRGHASGELVSGDSRTLHWRFGGSMPIPGGGQTGSGPDRTHNEMEVWFSSRDRLRVRVTDPDGEETDFVEPGETKAFPLPTGDVVFIDSVLFSPFNGESQIFVDVLPGGVAFNPAAPLNSGVWKVELEAIDTRDGRFDAWIERDFRSGGNNYADQSFFVGGDFDPVQTLGTPATTRRAVAVANYSDQTQDLNWSSSHGPTRDLRQKPEVAAPGTGIISSNSLGGRTVGGALIPVRASKTGTSMSAPHVAGIVALMLEANPKLTADQIRKILIASGRPQIGSTDSVYDFGFGFGRVDAFEAVTGAERIA